MKLFFLYAYFFRTKPFLEESGLAQVRVRGK